MMNLRDTLLNNENFLALYGPCAEQLARYEKIAGGFKAHFEGDIHFFSTSGRTEIIGNHTDHNAGCVLAGGISLDTVAAAAKNTLGRVRMVSEGFQGMFEVDLADTAMQHGEQGSTNAIIRGVAARFVQLGYQVGGFDAYISSNVLRGSGLSSSAAVEVLLCTMFSEFYNNGAVPHAMMGEISQFAENQYFGKPCGLMDQTACAIGSIISIDFKQPKAEIVRIPFDFARYGYGLIITDVKEDHADLTGEYAAITEDMRAVATFFGQEKLRFVQQTAFYAALPRLRKAVSDRACLRAIHFFEENQRVGKAVKALQENRLQDFFDQINASGVSSHCLLQNLCVPGSGDQAIPLALHISRNILQDRGGVRVHGGGFGGTILAFVPLDLHGQYIAAMDDIFGYGAACQLQIRAQSTLQVL